jgi:hypothetical protein
MTVLSSKRAMKPPVFSRLSSRRRMRTLPEHARFMAMTFLTLTCFLNMLQAMQRHFR